MKANARGFPVMCTEAVMRPKAHGTTEKPVMDNLRFGCDRKTADKICCYNRHYAEHSGYALSAPRTWRDELSKNIHGEMTYYDSVTGKPLFIAPRGRSMDHFIKESRAHGWPSFRDEEVVWDHVRCLPNGETVSEDGTHLGHNLPDRKGNRYCINLVCVAGNPLSQ